MNKKRIRIKETSYFVRERSGDFWYEEIYNWIFNSSFSRIVDTEDSLEERYND